MQSNFRSPFTLVHWRRFRNLCLIGWQVAGQKFKIWETKQQPVWIKYKTRTHEVVVSNESNLFHFSALEFKFYLCIPVTFMVFYIFIGLIGCSLNLEISCDARKLARTPRVTKIYIYKINKKVYVLKWRLRRTWETSFPIICCFDKKIYKTRRFMSLSRASRQGKGFWNKTLIVSTHYHP